MSMNLRIPGFKGCLLQTTTEFSYRAIKLNDRYKILELYYQEYVKPKYPKDLCSKDSRNKFLVKQRELEIRILEEEAEQHMQHIKKYFDLNTQAKWIIR